MTLKSLIQFPILAPPNPTHHRPATEVRFSRWNSATNAEKFIRQERTQNPIEDELRHLKRFNSGDNATNKTTNGTFKSTGVPSSPSRPSNTGNKSYSKTPRNTHPAFRRISKAIRVPTDAAKAETGVRVSEDGVSYVLPNAPFAFQHSYTETPKVKPLHLREPPVAPFGPSTMPRPWTGRKPLPPGKKKLEFDSFRLPPAGKKGVKPVQAPGPFLPGSGPKYVRSREEVLGEPLTKEEVDEMVMACKKTRRQLNMGRDGLTHNMLDNIHALWKRKRVCKIKCLGVCTVDMDNVRQQLEEKTGGKIIYSRGGIIYLFRGRNYNYKTRPQFPLMLWKPITPVYPRLIERAPGGLTVEEAREMRDKGRKLTPICKLGKNGVYCDLVKNVKEAFEACELVRINCEGMNANDYRKIGAKLKDLVPCVLISFEREHILMWRGRDWKSSLPQLVDVSDAKNSETDGVISNAPDLEGQVVTALSIPKPEALTSLQTFSSSNSPICSEDTNVAEGEGTSTKAEDHFPLLNDASSLVSGSVSNAIDVCSNSETDGAISISPHLEGEMVTASPILSEGLTCIETLSSSTSPICNGDVQILGANSTSMEAENHLPDTSSLVSPSLLNETDVSGSNTPSTVDGRGYDAPDGLSESHGGKIVLRTTGSDNDEATITSVSDSIDLEKPLSLVPPTCNELQDSPDTLQNLDEPTSLSSPWTEEVLALWKEAIECGRATVLDDSSLDADVVYRRAVALSQSAPPGPVFRHRRKKVAVRKLEEPKTEDLAVKEEVMVSEKEGSEKKRSSINRRMKGIKREYLNEVPPGSLGVDELAKLLA